MIDVREYWRLAFAKRVDDLRPFFRQDAAIRWHNTNEEFDVEEFLQVLSQCPGKWQGEFWRVAKTGDGMLTVLRVFPKKGDGPSYRVCAFFTFRKSRLAAIDFFWGDDLPAPEGHREQGLGHPIAVPEEAAPEEPLPVVLRRAAPEDFPGIQALVKLELDLHYENRPDYFQWGTYSQKEYSELMARPGSIAWAAELEGRIVGACLGKIGRTPETDLRKARKIAVIQDLAVLPEFRKKGVAALLMAKAREQAEQAGAAAMELSVWDFNKEAVTLYRRLGLKDQYRRMELPL